MLLTLGYLDPELSVYRFKEVDWRVLVQGWFAGFGVTGFGVLVLGCRDFGLGVGMPWGFRVCCLGFGGFRVWGLRIWVEVGGVSKGTAAKAGLQFQLPDIPAYIPIWTILV